jgi:hypothetical protein
VQELELEYRDYIPRASVFLKNEIFEMGARRQEAVQEESLKAEIVQETNFHREEPLPIVAEVRAVS